MGKSTNSTWGWGILRSAPSRERVIQKWGPGLRLKLCSCHCFFVVCFVFETGFHVAQAGWSSRQSCVSLLRARMTALVTKPGCLYLFRLF